MPHLSRAVASIPATSLVWGAAQQAGGHRPFQCRYCPYSASQKGNLKTHVLCVHRMPFDNSQYPDRRFKRSRVDSEASGNFEDPTAVKAGSSAELTEEGYKAQEERN
ncbi:Zinc Finger X-Chromosomal Protein [Manis pentadactyla]|nr:Zinc Finger X-Chromosomal Protein [Manis pentadactyla]